jgi:hypothetical protein
MECLRYNSPFPAKIHWEDSSLRKTTIQGLYIIHVHNVMFIIHYPLPTLENFTEWAQQRKDKGKSLLCMYTCIMLPAIAPLLHALCKCIVWGDCPMRNVRSPWDIEVCVLHYCAADMWIAGWRGDFAILYLAQRLAPVPYGIDANGC